MFGGEVLVLIGYLVVSQVLNSNPLVAALTGGEVQPWLAALWLTTVGMFATAGAYHQRLSLSVREELPALSWRAGLALITTVAAADRFAGNLCRDAVLVLGLSGMGSHLVIRLGVFALLRERRLSQNASCRALVVGGGPMSRQVVELLDADSRFGLRVLGYVDDAHAPLVTRTPNWTYLGRVEDLPATVERLKVHAVLTGFSPEPHALPRQTLGRLAEAQVRVFSVPQARRVRSLLAGQDRIGPIALARVRQSRANRAPITADCP